MSGESGAAQRGRSETVLVIEDDALLRDVVLLMLEDAGYDAIAAEDYATAEQLVTSRPVALLLADSNLAAGVGRKDALAFARHHRIPLLMMSGSFARRTAEELPKPFTDEELIAAVEQALSRDPPR